MCSQSLYNIIVNEGANSPNGLKNLEKLMAGACCITKSKKRIENKEAAV